MTNKEYLMQYRTYKLKIEQAKESLIGMAESIDSVSIDYSGMPHGTGTANPTERYVLSLDEAMRERRDSIQTYREKLTEIENAIMAIEDPIQSRVLWLRYVKCWAWDDIADDPQVALSVDHVRSRFHGRALQQIKQP